ncbi:hypothetical protein Tco_1418639 [Tanacetum coccineum]
MLSSISLNAEKECWFWTCLNKRCSSMRGDVSRLAAPTYTHYGSMEEAIIQKWARSDGEEEITGTQLGHLWSERRSRCELVRGVEYGLRSQRFWRVTESPGLRCESQLDTTTGWVAGVVSPNRDNSDNRTLLCGELLEVGNEGIWSRSVGVRGDTDMANILVGYDTCCNKMMMRGGTTMRGASGSLRREWSGGVGGNSLTTYSREDTDSRRGLRRHISAS